MQDNVRGWMPYIIGAVVGGGAIGYLIKRLLKMILVGEKWALLINSAIPLFVIGSLLFVLVLYNKDKEDTIE